MGWAWNTVSCHRGRSRLAACVPLPFAAWMLMVGCVGCETKAASSGMGVGRGCLRGQTGSCVGVVEKEGETNGLGLPE